ncbi:hypothetical protein IW261DRAFT_1603131 [Armillaria novae-zelandiae]|uniref:Secreted protein n=1 Tax=Armillaria novae-zelandiae TaxID=153914 RepID=A0AA39UIT0_9AGAR|nr:hypothetical protein IW261DRAFT_1603131 [Armillaria novae-zelandiae]
MYLKLVVVTLVLALVTSASPVGGIGDAFPPLVIDVTGPGHSQSSRIPPIMDATTTGLPRPTSHINSEVSLN